MTLALLAMLLAAESDDAIERAREQLARFDEKGAIHTLEQARASPDLTPEQLAKLQLYLGLAHAGLADERAALAAFKHAVLLDPELRLPDGVSPTVERWWKAAGGKPKLVPADTVEGPPPAPIVTAPPPAPEPPATPLRRWVGGALLGLGALALAAGIGTGVHALSVHDRAQREPDITTALLLQSEANGVGATANLLYGLAGLFGLAGLILLLIPADTGG